MNEDKIKKIILFFVIIFLIYLILRYANSMKPYTYIPPMSTTSNVVYDKRNVHYYMPQSVPHYNAYKAQFYN